MGIQAHRARLVLAKGLMDNGGLLSPQLSYSTRDNATPFLAHTTLMLQAFPAGGVLLQAGSGGTAGTRTLLTASQNKASRR